MSFQRPEILWALALLAPYAAVETWSVLQGGKLAALLSPGTEAKGSRSIWRRRRVLRVLGGAWAWAFTVMALAGPSLGFLPALDSTSGAEASLVLDVSHSMLSEDIPPSRLSSARDTARALIRMRPDVSFSVTAFKGAATLLCPVTDDLDALDQALDWAVPSVLTAPGSSTAAGLRTALEGFSRNPAMSRYVLLFSDGNDLAGGADKAARAAREQGVRILAVGCGGDVEVPAMDEAGHPIQTPDGSAARTALRVSWLRGLAEETGGLYVDVSDPTALKILSNALNGGTGSRARAVTKPADRTGLSAFLALLGLILRSAAAFPKKAGKQSRRGAAAGLVILVLTGCSGPRMSVLRGNQRAERGRYEEAIAEYLKAGTEEGDGLVALNLAGIYSRLGEHDAAAPLYEIARNARDLRVAAAAHHNQGVELFEASRFEESEEEFKKALRLYPGDPETKRALELAREAASSRRTTRTAQRHGAELGSDGRKDALFNLLRRMESNWFRPAKTAEVEPGGVDH